MKNTNQIVTIILFFLMSYSYAQTKDSLMYVFGQNLKVYKKTNSNIFQIKRNKKIIYNNLKFIEILGTSLQVLDKNNTIYYIDLNGKKETEPNIDLGVCGLVPYHIYEISKQNGKHILTHNESYNRNDNTNPIAIDSIKANEVDEIYFWNKKKRIEIDGNEFVFSYTKVFPYALIVKKDNKLGILFKNKLSFYDEVIYDSGLLKVLINGECGYYGITKVKYKKLGSYNFGLAKFKTIDGKNGYVDRNGNEYYE